MPLEALLDVPLGTASLSLSFEFPHPLATNMAARQNNANRLLIFA